MAVHLKRGKFVIDLAEIRKAEQKSQVVFVVLSIIDKTNNNG